MDSFITIFGVITGGILLMILLGIALVILWILTLIKQLKKKEIAWFVLTLIFPFVMLLYWIVKWVR